MAFTPKNWIDSPSTSTPLSAVAIEDLEIRVTDYADLAGGMVFNAQTYGAVADGVTDDKPAIADAEAAARAVNGVVFYPPSPTGDEYMISEPLAGDVSQVGATPDVMIMAHDDLASATNKMLLDLGLNYPSVYRRTFKNLTLNGRGLTDVQIVASSQGRAGNSLAIFENMLFQSSGAGVFACGLGPGVDPEPITGMFCGSTWINCTWDDCVHALKIGVNSDGVAFINPRFSMVKDAVADNAVGPYIWIFAGDVCFKGGFASIGNTGYHVAGNNLSAFMRCQTGGNAVRIESFGFEATGVDSDMLNLFYCENTPLIINGAEFYLTGAESTVPEMTAMVSANTASTYGLTADLRNITTDLSTMPLLEVGIGNGATDTFSYAFENVDMFDEILTIIGNATIGEVVKLHGVHRGVHYARATDKARRETYGVTGAYVASATTIAIPFADVVHVTGTADITTVTASVRSTPVTLVFDETAATNGVVDGSNLKLAGNLVYSPNDTLTLICDGVDWYEIARSVN